MSEESRPAEQTDDRLICDLDELIGLYRRRLARLERERERATFHSLECLLHDRKPPASSDRLVAVLDKRISEIEHRVCELEAQRQEALLLRLAKEW
jgi:hypothetical protein